MSNALSIVVLVFAVLGMVAGWLALRTLGRLRRSVGVLGRFPGSQGETLLEVVANQIEATERAQLQFYELNLSVLAAVERFETRLAELPPPGTGAGGSATSDPELAAAVATELVAGLATDLSAELDFIRTENGTQIDATRAEVVGQLEGLKQVVNAELAQLRQGIETQRDTALAEIAEQRTRLATDNTAAKNQVRSAVERVEQAIDGSLRRVALVRFDAFEDLSGRLSFSLALLDGRGDGVTLTSLAGRSETHIYAKPINAGRSPAELSPEEQQAVEAALRV